MVTRPGSFEVQGEFDLLAASPPVFEGPLDLLLSLTACKKPDITEAVLAQVTDESTAFMKVFLDLSRMTEFLVVAATLLDMKAAHLLSSVDEGDNTPEVDLEARDLLFSRLLWYRAFREATKHIDVRMGEYDSYVARSVPLEPHFASLLLELRWLTTSEDLARLAADALPPTDPTVQVAHLYDPVVPVRVQALPVSSMLTEVGCITFHQLVEDTPTRVVVVFRSLVFLEPHRRGAVEFEQNGAPGTLTTQ